MKFGRTKKLNVAINTRCFVYLFFLQNYISLIISGYIYYAI